MPGSSPGMTLKGGNSPPLGSPLSRARYPLPRCGRGLFASGVEEAAQFARAARVLELPERLRLDLADALAGDRELLADLLERVVGVHADPEAHAQDALFARGQRRQDPGRRLAQIRLDRRVQW